MKGIILAAGQGTRLRPLTKVFSKVLLPVYDKPMIYYAIEKLQKAGIDDIAIVISPQHKEQFEQQLADFTVTFVIQEDAKGTGHALSLTEDFADGDSVCVVYGDNIFEDDLDLDDFQRGLRLFLREVAEPQRFGVATIEDGKVVELVEKPENPKSNLAVLGMYAYDNNVYQHLRNLKPSPRGEYEITDVHDIYAKEGKADFRILRGFWSDAGKHDTLLEAGVWAKER